ncbi:MAG: hypothetical protein HOP19_25355 [Acidobacteria bacterium]|nr:hypothetical protein [Acidobacteriota bacterium]
MFGLMKAQSCSQSPEARETHRQLYCGVCKSLGGLYGQRTRFLLNYDVVFLAELLSALSNEPQHEWATAYRSLNCLSLPSNETEVPLVLQFTASANVALTQAKLRDHLDDAPDMRWRTAQRVLCESFEQAVARLVAWGFPVAELERLAAWQREREATVRRGEAAMSWLAEPTAAITASFFRCGVRLIGRVELEDQVAQLGFTFGELTYWLDALADYEADVRAGQFNALRAAFGWQSDRLQTGERQQATTEMLSLFAQVVAQMRALPLPTTVAAGYVERLRLNLSCALNTTIEREASRASCQRAFAVLPRARWERAQVVMRELRQQPAQLDCAWWERAFAPLAYLAVLIGALFLPDWIGRVRSWRDGFGLATNLMFLGALPGAVLALVTLGLNDDPQKKQRQAQQKQSCSQQCKDNCQCDCPDCDCCDCCCECDSCHCNCCDGCCAGCCDGCGCDCGH